MADSYLLAVLRVAHALTAAVWLGVSLVGVVSPPALDLLRTVGGWSLRAVGRGALWALVISGVPLMLDRLADPAVSTLYIVLLGLKLALVAAMGLLGLVGGGPHPPAPLSHGERGGTRGRVQRPGGLGGPLPSRSGGWGRLGAHRERLFLGLGLGAFVLGTLLTSAYEAVLRGP